jgi:hypothetical protein
LFAEAALLVKRSNRKERRGGTDISLFFLRGNTGLIVKMNLRGTLSGSSPAANLAGFMKEQ